MDGDTASSTTPFTPPTTEEARLSWLRLIRSRRVGPASFSRLMEAHGCAEAVLDALPGIARASGIEDYHPCPIDDARREMDAGRKIGARLLCLGDPPYPRALAALPDAPPVLWARGRGGLLTGSLVAMVGARNASALGGRMTRKLAEGLGWHGHVVVSGLARGIDTAAHGASLKTGTVAVLAGGVDVIYPAENAALAAAIADQGLLVSEQPVGMQPQARHFPARNRIIAGLARAVVVIEAAEGSGSLITARHALDQGRELLAVPGHPLDGRAAGCNALIREGAWLIRDVADIVDVIGKAPARPTRAPGTITGRRHLAAGTLAHQPEAARPMPAPQPGPAGGSGGGTRARGQAMHGTARPATGGINRAEGAAVAAGRPTAVTPAAGSGSRGRWNHPPGPGKGAAYGASLSPNDAERINDTTGRRTDSAARTVQECDAQRVQQSRKTQGQPPSVNMGQQGSGQQDCGQRRGGKAGPETAQPPPDMLRLHAMILDLLGPSPLAEDQLIRDLALPAACVAPALLFLELDGRILRQPGGMLSRR